MTYSRNIINFLTAATLLVAAVGCVNGKENPDDGGTTVPPEPPLIEKVDPKVGEIVRGSVVKTFGSATYDPYTTPGRTVFFFEVGENESLTLDVDSEILSLGNIDLKQAGVTLRYGTFTYDSATSRYLKEGHLSLHITGRNVVELDFEVELSSTDRVAGVFKGECLKQYQRLSNAYHFDSLQGEITGAVCSVVECFDYAARKVKYGLFQEEGVQDFGEVTPIAVVEAPVGTDLSDVLLVPESEVSVEVFGKKDISSAHLKVLRQEALGTINISIELTDISDGYFRTSYNKACSISYVSTRCLTRYKGGEESRCEVSRIFHRYASNSIDILLGDKSNPEQVESLMEGLFALEINISPDMDGQEMDASQISDYTLNFYDYTVYETFRHEKGATGSILVKTVPGREDHLYVDFDITLKANGERVTFNYFGPADWVDDTCDITPVPPFTPHFGIYKPNGDSVQKREIIRMEMRRETSVRQTISGELWKEAIFFYFPTIYTQANGGVDAAVATPCLMLNPKLINAGEIDLALCKEDEYAFFYTTSNFYLFSNLGGICSNSRGYGPTTARLKVDRDGDYYEISMYVLDWGKANWFTENEQGTNYEFLLEWKGEVSPYSGSKKNEL